MARPLLLLCSLIVLSRTQDVPTLPRLLGDVYFKQPAFMEIYEDEDKTAELPDRLTLYVSTFNPAAFFTEDPVFYLRSPGRLLDDVANWQLAELDRSAFWPNNPDYLPSSVVGFEGVVWTSGFLVPSKTKGQLQLYNRQDLTAPAINIASADPRDFSYHRVIWKDMDGDGDLDALTARFHNADQEQQLLWMENPGSAVEGWTQHVLVEMGPDVHFRNVKIQSGAATFDCILGGEFWQEKVKIYCIDTAAPGGWMDPSNIQAIVIDDTCGQVFDVYIDDFNRDGKIEFLATAYNTSIKMGSVHVYEIPETFPSGAWNRITIADGFVPNFILGGQSMSPGTPKPFYPSVAYETEVLPDGRQRKPWLAVSGDDDGKVYIIRPLSEDPSDWTYEKSILVDTQETTSGKMAIADLDGDGYREIVAAGYSANRLYVFTYTP